MIRFDSISKMYAKKHILSNVSFEIDEKKISFIMGENGAGKTTLIKCMVNLEAYEGKITYNNKLYENVRDKCFVLYDDCPFYSNLSGWNNLFLLSENRIAKAEVVKVAERYLDRQVLSSKVKKYSNGQRKKLGIILLELLNPKYIILDEISNGLDYLSLKELKVRIRQWSLNSTIIMTGHQFDFYNDLIDDLFLFKDGDIKKESSFSKGVNKLEEIYDEKMY